MKLKKIASLALAGIMAVSMLTACGEGGSSSSEPTNPVAPTASNVANYVNDLLTDAQKEKISFTDGEALRAAVTAVATNASVITPSMIENAYDQHTSACDIKSPTNVENKTKDEFNSGIIVMDGFSNWTTLAPANNEKSDSYLDVYVLDGAMSEVAVAGAIYDCWGSYITALNTAVNGNDAIWSGDVAAVKVYNSRNASKSAWVVGVMFTKTSTNGTNTQV